MISMKSYILAFSHIKGPGSNFYPAVNRSMSTQGHNLNNNFDRTRCSNAACSGILAPKKKVFKDLLTIHGRGGHVSIGHEPDMDYLPPRGIL